MLKFNLDSTSFDSLDDTQKTLYSKSENGYQLQVEGAVGKGKVDEFRTSNIALQEKLKAFDGVDLDKYNSALETERKLRDKKLIDAGDFDTLLAEKTASMQSDFQAKFDTLTNQNKALVDQNTASTSKAKIDDVAMLAFSKYKIQPEAHKQVMADIRATFSVDGDNVVGKNGDKILTGANGNLTIDEHIAALPEFMKIPSKGGNGRGGQNVGEGGDPMANRRAAYAKKFG